MSADSETLGLSPLVPVPSAAPSASPDTAMAPELAGSVASQAAVAVCKVVNSKRAWTEHEDQLLLETVGKLGAQRWSLIASHLPGRVGKQCRERWFNHLCPEVTSARPAACYPRRQPTGPEPYAVGIEVATSTPIAASRR